MATGFSATPPERSTCLARPLNQIVVGQAFFFAEAVRHIAMAPLTPVHTADVTSELAAPTLQRSEPYPQQTSDYSGSCTGSHRGLKDLQCFAAIDGCGQSPASSPQ